ncbi:CHAD domain-containing protein [Chitinophaga polysaccharea]|uniref:CHAD domain-containing protein n=1 Tax=Chitinophaga polysaccharea TaxID=1293035 RepID=A0A561PLP0_9BACT|nr:CHAD domain-containing protein [Chitinophaga polysaccharea]TWF39026.1 CHAD domain-containing protein [Chitinophaga polysaccharea]
MLLTALYQYLRKECDTVISAYDTLQQMQGDADAVHQLRVGVKKLRAFFALAKQLPDYSFGAGKHLHTARLIQSVGGASRDAHLQEKHLRLYEKKVAWRFSFAHLLLQKKHTTAIDLLQDTIKHTSLKKLETLPERFSKAIEKMDKTAATEALRQYLYQQHQQIILPAGRVHHAEWHEVRKQVKSLYYQLTILAEVLPTTYTDTLTKHTGKAGELLGQWHDTSELSLFVGHTITQLRKEKIALPEPVRQLQSRLKADTRAQLLQCSKQIKMLMEIGY